MHKALTILCFLAVLMFFWAQPAWANAGLPMIVLGLPFLITALIPVVVIEAWIYHRELSCPLKKSLAGASAANILSTLIGYPLAWILQVIVMLAVGAVMFLLFRNSHPPDYLQYFFFPFFSAWLMPGALTWHIFLAGLIGLVPAFFVSFWCEWRLLQRLWKDINPQLIRRAAWKANTTTYIILGGLLTVLTLFQLLIHLNAFDFLRSRSDEQITFQRPLTGEIVVLASSDHLIVDPVTAERKKILPAEIRKTVRELKTGAITDDGIWFTDYDYEKRITRLYFMARPFTQPKAMGDFRSIRNLNAVGSDVIFEGQALNSPDKYYRLDGVYLVSTTGKIQTLMTGDVEERLSNLNYSPVERKAVYLKFVSSQPLDQSGQVYLVNADIRLLDFSTGEDKKLVECRGVSTYPKGTYDVTFSAWSPDGERLYFSTLSGEAISSSLPTIDIQKLIVQYRLEGGGYRLGDETALLRDLRSKLGMHIFELDISSGRLEDMGPGFGVRTVSADGKRLLLEGNEKERDYSVLEKAGGRIVPVDPLNPGYGFQQVSFSPDGEFLIYSGTSRDFFDRHYLSDSVDWFNRRPSWLWIKDIETGVERRLGLRPVMGLSQLEWVEK